MAASYDNNAAPGNGLADGTYDAAPGVAPGWDVVNGWIGGGGAYLRTGIVPISQDCAFIARYTGCGGFQCVLGCMNDTSDVRVWLYGNIGNVWYGNGASLAVGAPLVAGILAVSGATGYRNGVADPGAIGAWVAANTREFFLLARNQGGWGSDLFTGALQAVAIYVPAISAAQVLAVATAMAAL